MTSLFLNVKKTDKLITDLQTDGIGKIMEYAQLGVWGNIPWKYELNPVSVLGGDVMTSFFLMKIRQTNL